MTIDFAHQKLVPGHLWFTSDQHFDHKNVIKYCKRPFHHPSFLPRLREWYTGEVSQEAINLMNEALIQNFNELVSADDVTFHLGDFSLNKAGPEKYLHRLNGKHVLIMGNHDSVHPAVRMNPKKREEIYNRYRAAGFSEIHETLHGEIMGEPVQLHHMPFARPGVVGYDQRYLEMRPADTGQILLHGHVHEAWKHNGRMFNVGVDVNNYRPVSLGEVAVFVARIQREQMENGKR